MNAIHEQLRIGEWCADRASGALSGPAGTTRLEPKVMDLLFVLAAERGQVVPRERLLDELWPGVVVGEDVLARTVFKLRQALGDDAKAPRYVETIAKRGYRLVASVDPDGRQPDVAREAASAPPAVAAPVSVAPRRRIVPAVAFATLALLAIAAIGLGLRRTSPEPAATPDASPVLVARADDFYFQFSRADNERAIELYERVLGLHPDDPAALAGLANALTQRSVRWPDATTEPAPEFTQLGDALAHGHLAEGPALRRLERARRLAERAVEVAPASSAAHKALGFVQSAQREFDAALASYERAIALDADAWGAMINVGDVLEITGRDADALPWFERAYEAMVRAYARNPAQVRPWHAELGVLVAGRHLARGDTGRAETWYRRVLSESPLHPGATRGLATLLREGGDRAAADRLCAELVERLRDDKACDATAGGSTP